MIKISYWARQNPSITRVLIFFTHILLCVLGILMGKNLLAAGIQVSSFLLITTLVLFMSGILFYPTKKQRSGFPVVLNFYYRQKLCDWMLAFSLFLIAGFISNSSGNPFILSGFTKGAAVTTSSVSSLPEGDGKGPKIKLHYTKAERKAMLKELKKVLKESLRKDKDQQNKNATRIALVILAIIGAVGLGILVAAVSCNILCNGSEAGAAIVLILGAGAIAVLLTLTIKAIARAYPRSPRFKPGENVHGTPL